ncbi:TonB-dependent receptor [Exilibacterium tricleocarpae]|uniref:TonB-dependent receptor n=1 Tax=Exilibacterium tricleocarpae TaxID=2591008 RepID=A0A545SQU2_9GAMM|nr:TonB-dependent receptor [Exilibacterium tricleocarpae]TQV67341.1 TonB-dependent receptor [Exilibacterium tricleocarpae]
MSANHHQCPVAARGYQSPFTPRLLSLAVTAVALSASVTAQEPSIEMLEEIIVTTERREMRIQDVSATVEQFSANDLRNLGVNNDFKNLQNAVSGLNIAKQEGKVEVYLRGIGSSDSDFSSDPSVATHYNGVYLPRPRSIGPMFFDVSRVEVHKGPQGTVRGRNATGGSINIISNRPELDEFSGKLAVGTGDFDSNTAEVVFNVPVTDNFAVRGAFFSEQHDSYLTNEYGSGIEAPGSVDDQAWRISALWEATDALTVNLIIDASESDGTGQPGAFSGRALAAGFDMDDLDDPWNQYFLAEGEQESDQTGVSLTVQYQFETFAVEYSGSVRDYEFDNRNGGRIFQMGHVFPGTDREANFVEFFANPPSYPDNRTNLFPDLLNARDAFRQNEESTSQVHELRFFGGEDSFLRWSTGVFYMQEEFDNVSWNVNDGLGFAVPCGGNDVSWIDPPLPDDTICAFQDGLGGENRNDGSEVESMAVYFDGTLNISDATRVNFGVRWTDDTKTQVRTNLKYLLIAPGEAIEAFTGRPINRATDPATTGLIMGGNGFALAPPGGRSQPLPTDVCPNGDWFAPGCGGDPYNLEFFLGGIDRFGNGDNVDEFLAQFGDQVDVHITSDFYTDTNRSVRESNEYSASFVDWRLGVEYDLSDTQLLYAQVSTGTRSGGVNDPIITPDGEQVNREWGEEELTAYEVGSKNEFDLGTTALRLNAALFYYDFKDKTLQSLINVGLNRDSDGDGEEDTTSKVFVDNVGDAEVLGLEVESLWALPYGVDLKGNLLLADGTYEDAVTGDSRFSNPVLVPLDGNQLPYLSEVTLNLAVSQTIELNWGSLQSFDWTLSMNYRSEYFLSPYNGKGYADADGDGIGERVPLVEMVPNNSSPTASGGNGDANGNFFLDEVDAFAQFNLAAGLDFGTDGQFRLDGYVNNITEEAYSGKAFINRDVNIRFLNNPRTYGLRFSAVF